jgi:hypothetical protein
MFPLIGLGEVVTVLADAVIVAVALARWSFVWLRTFAAWLAITAAIVALLLALLTAVVQASGWGSAATAVAAIGSVPALFVARALALRRMSRSLVFRRDLRRAFGWGWAIAVSIGGFLAALALGGLVQALAGDI